VGEVWHRTGDAAWLDAEGRLWIVGRVADMVRRGDAVYHPAAVEAAARAVPGVSRAALIGDAAGAETALVVELSESGRGRRAGRAAVSALRERMAAAGIAVDRIELASELPVDPRHRAKLDYPAIRQRWGRAPLNRP
jgi:acyl-coenzyme A synthetase/AMP-(fatty) acid ligase